MLARVFRSTTDAILVIRPFSTVQLHQANQLTVRSPGSNPGPAVDQDTACGETASGPHAR